MRWNRALVLAALLIASGETVRAEDDGLKLHPVPGLFGIENSTCTPDAQVEVVIASSLCSRLAPIERRRYWGQRFSSLLTDRLGAARIQSDLGGSLAAGLTREAMLSRTLVASAHLSRADIWTVPKPSGVEVHMPLTVSLLMTNVLTGEVVFAQTLSTDVFGQMSEASYEAQAAEQFDEKLDTALVQLIDKALAEFRPGAIDAVVRGRIGDRYVIDAGMREGLREGDQVGVDARVIFADDHYAVVETTLEGLHVGQKLTRYIARPVEQLDRPSLLVVVAQTPKDFPSSFATALMEDALAAAGGFAVVSVNPAAADIRGPALNNAGVNRQDPALPDFFLRTTVAPLDVVQYPTNVAGVDRRVQAAHVYLEVINKEGRVVFASEGKDERIDEISGGMAPSTPQRRDAAVRNAMLRAVQSLRVGFSPAHLRLNIQSAEGDEVSIEDRGGALGIGLNARVLRSAGRMSGIEGDVWAPVADVQVVAFGPGTATARQSGVETARVRRNDQIAYQTTGALARSRYSFSQCPDASGLLRPDTRGEPQPLFQPIAFNSFAAGFKGAVHAAGFDLEAGRLNLGSLSHEYMSIAALKPVQTDYCFTPVHNLASKGDRPSGRNFVQSLHELTVGFALRRNGERVAGSGLQQEITATATPQGAPPSLRDASLQIDLADIAADLARRAAADIQPPQ